MFVRTLTFHCDKLLVLDRKDNEYTNYETGHADNFDDFTNHQYPWISFSRRNDNMEIQRQSGKT